MSIQKLHSSINFNNSRFHSTFLDVILKFKNITDKIVITNKILLLITNYYY